MNIVFRVDSGAQIGSGHLMRCLTLANELRQCGVKVSFISRLHKGHLIARLEQEGHIVHKLQLSLNEASSLSGYEAWLGVTQAQDARDTVAAIDEQHYDCLVVDHYALDHVWERMLRNHVDRLMAIDDLANRKHDCDLLLDQNYFGIKTEGRYKSLVSTSTQRLLGPQFALLQPEYARLRVTSVLSDGHVVRVLVFFGNADLEDQTSNVLAALSSPELDHLLVDVVVGTNHPDPKGLEEQVKKRGNVTFYHDLPTLAGLIMKADLVIGAGGGTTWERMCLGRPSLVASLAENQDLGAQVLSEEGYQTLLNAEHLTVNDWKTALFKLIKAPEVLTELSYKADLLVDGLGCKRVCVALLGKENINMSIRNATINDEKLLLYWSSDKVTRSQSFCQDRITVDEHKAWFKKKLVDPNRFIFIAEAANKLPLGMVRFDLDIKQKEALISISVEPSMRGKGIAINLMEQAMQKISLIEPRVTFIAEVRNSNIHSQRLFKKLNFTPVTSFRNDALKFERLVETLVEDNV